jgi:hypothetical protein
MPLICRDLEKKGKKQSNGGNMKIIIILLITMFMYGMAFAKDEPQKTDKTTEETSGGRYTGFTEVKLKNGKTMIGVVSNDIRRDRIYIRLTNGLTFTYQNREIESQKAIIEPEKVKKTVSFISFRIDQIASGKGFFSLEQQKSSSVDPKNLIREKMAIFVVLTNTSDLVNGDWFKSAQEDFSKGGIITNQIKGVQYRIYHYQPSSKE